MTAQLTNDAPSRRTRIATGERFNFEISNVVPGQVSVIT
jgi:hypothetical protein